MQDTNLYSTRDLYFSSFLLATNHDLQDLSFDNLGGFFWFVFEDKDECEKLEKLFQAHQPKMLIINFPNNPTGVILDEKQLNGICSLAKKYNCFLLSDEIYKDLSFANPVKNAFSIIMQKIDKNVNTFKKCRPSPANKNY